MRDRAGAAVAWLREPLPAPPTTLRRGPLAPRAFPSRLRSPRADQPARGRARASRSQSASSPACFSHLIQHPPGWFCWPSAPSGSTGSPRACTSRPAWPRSRCSASKLWSVYPAPVPLAARPRPRTRGRTAQRRGAGRRRPVPAGHRSAQHRSLVRPDALLLPQPPTTGRPGSRSARSLIHIGVKLPIIRNALTHRPRGPVPPAGPEPARAARRRRGRGRRHHPRHRRADRPHRWRRSRCSHPRRPRIGPQHLPVNRTAAAAGVRTLATDPGYRLLRRPAPAAPAGSALADLERVATAHRLPADHLRRRAGAPTAHLDRRAAARPDALVGADPDRHEVFVESLETAGLYRSIHRRPRARPRPADARRAAPAAANRCTSTTAIPPG